MDDREEKLIPGPSSSPSYKWRAYHGVLFLIGAVGFLVASPLFFPKTYAHQGIPTLAGCLYTIGSFSFLLADLTEWQYMRAFGFGDSVNFIGSSIGSFFYTIGSVLFIPAAYSAFWGDLLFVVGSSFIALSQAAKLLRSGDIVKDTPAFVVDFATMIGGSCYLLGSSCGLGDRDTGYCTLNSIAVIYTCGGTSFCTASAAMLYRYFLSSSMSRPTRPTSFAPFFNFSA